MTPVHIPSATSDPVAQRRLVVSLSAGTVGWLAPGMGLAQERPTGNADLATAAALSDLGWLFVVAVGCIVVIAVADWGTARARRYLRWRRGQRGAPGRSPLSPLKVESFDEVFRRRARSCTCGARPKVVFEGPTCSRNRKLWLMIEICPDCQNRLQTYFDVTEARTRQDSDQDVPPTRSTQPVTPVPR